MIGRQAIGKRAKWILYLEGQSDLAILRSFALRLNHRAEVYLREPFYNFVGLDIPLAHRHFRSMRDSCPSLLAFAVFDSVPPKCLTKPEGFTQHIWQRREIENYLSSFQALLKWARSKKDSRHPLRSHPEELMLAAVNESAGELLCSLNLDDPAGYEIKVSDLVLLPIMHSFCKKMDLSLGVVDGRISKSIFAEIVQFIPLPQIDREVKYVLDKIVATAELAERTVASKHQQGVKFSSTKCE